MADYFSPTVVQQSIPIADMTPLERLVLAHVFDAEPDGEALYFHSAFGPTDLICLPIDEARAAFEASGTNSAITARIAERLGAAEADAAEIEIDLSDDSWNLILQNIVRRSKTLDYITIVSAFTCSKMRPDGFGGMAVMVTADAIESKSTDGILEEFIAAREASAPRAQSDALLRLREDAVRAQIAPIFETDPALAKLASDSISDDDIRAACLAIVDETDLSEERGAAEFRAALAAIRQAERRSRA